MSRHAAWLAAVRDSGVIRACSAISRQRHAAGLRTKLGGRSLHTKRRRRGAAESCTRDRQGGTPARRRHPDRLRVRGIESNAGQVYAAITERGTIRCDAVVLAGGAWSRLFCGNLGIDLPQLQVIGSVLRTQPLLGGPGVSLAGPKFGFRKRGDGGYIVSQAGALINDMIPDSLRLAGAFAPALRREWRSCASDWGADSSRNGGRHADGGLTPPRPSRPFGYSIPPGRGRSSTKHGRI